MRFLLLSLLFLTAACGTSRHVTNAPPTGEENQVVATLLGKTYHDADFYKPGDFAVDRTRNSIRRLQGDAVRMLLADENPQCLIKAGPEEIAEFIDWWSAEWTSMRNNYYSAETGSQIRQPLPGAENITINNPQAVKYAREQIERWHLWRCIQQTYGGDDFYRHEGLLRFAEPGEKVILSTKNVGDNLLVPMTYKAVPLPMSALKRLFQQAEEQGKLTFPNEERQRRFYKSYDPERVNMTPDEGRAALETPYWKARPEQAAR